LLLKIQNLQTPKKIYIHNLWPPKKTEIQKFWSTEKVVEIFAFRWSMQMSTVCDVHETPIDFDNVDLLTPPNKCELIDSIQTTTACGTFLATSPPNSVDISKLPFLICSKVFHSVHLFHYMRETSRTFIFSKMFPIFFELILLRYDILDIVSVCNIGCFVIFIWDPGINLI